MKFKLLLLFFLLGLMYNSTLRAQDLIVTVQNDSINANVTKNDSEFLHYDYVHTDGTIKQATLKMAEVREIIRDFYETSPATEYDYVNTKTLKYVDVKSANAKVSLRGFAGWSQRIGKIPETGLEDYYKELLSGYNYGGALNVYFSESFGFGVHIDQFRSSGGPIRVTATLPNGTNINGSLEDDVKIGFYSPVFVMRFEGEDPSDRIHISTGLGFTTWSHYSLLVNDANRERLSELYEGNTLGLYVGARYEIDLARNVGFNVGVDLHTASILVYDITFEDGSTVNVDATTTGEGEGLLRFSINGGLAINF